MDIAVISLLRDRLDYSRHCMQTLRNNAGCSFDWFVLDQGSTDGTAEWLLEQDDLDVTLLPENIGIPRGLNLLLDIVGEGYDCIVKIDNDAELLSPDTLATVCELVLETGWLLSPKIHGLRNPPQSYASKTVSGWEIDFTHIIGGIFLAAPGDALRNFRYPESLPLWGGDDSLICDLWRRNGKHVGYVADLHANHYEGTTNQWSRYPEYFSRAQREGKVLA